MGKELASWCLLLHLLLLLCAHRSEAREFGGNYDDGAHHGGMHEHHHLHTDPSSHMHHMMNSGSMLVFTIRDLMAAKKLPIHLPKTDPSNPPPLLSREEAETIPFSFKQLPHLLQLFSISPESSLAKSMEETLRLCETTVEQETRFCATSLESLVDSVSGIFGSESDFKVTSTTHLPETKTPFQTCSILEAPKEIEAPTMVACHIMPFPYVVFFCHSQTTTQNKLFKVSLGGEKGDRIEAIAICHMDTSYWKRDFMAFQQLGIQKPGSSEICHFSAPETLLWVPSAAIN